MKYKVGDKVRIIDHRNWWWNNAGSMDKYMNQVLTIKYILVNGAYKMEQCPEWNWRDEDIVEKVSEVNMTKKELKSKVEELEKELAKFKKELDKADKSPYCERVKSLDYYWSALDTGEAYKHQEIGCSMNRLHYTNANYFSDESFAKKVAAEQTLTNLLRKYTYEHGWSDDLWDGCDWYYRIFYTRIDSKFDVDDNKNWITVGAIYFIDKQTAQNAIQEVVIPFVKEHPELGYELKD